MRVPVKLQRCPWLVFVAPALLGGCLTGGALLQDTGFLYDWEVDPDQTPIPFGLWGLNGFHDPDGLEQVQQQFGISVFHTATYSPSYGVGMLLPMVREAGLHVNLRMAGDHSHYTTADGDFDIEAWKEMLAPWDGSGVQEYIDDGTILYHMLIDDITTFGGRSPSAVELEEMARYSKTLMPGLKVAVREGAAWMPQPQGGRYEYVDASINQYLVSFGDVEEYALDNAAAADTLGLEIVNGLNMADGGNGTSGQPGWGAGRYAMSAEEIIKYGYVLSAVRGCEMFLAWEYDGEELWPDGSVGADYFDQPDITAALQWLSLRLAGEDVDPP